jgi:hypothetical protein
MPEFAERHGLAYAESGELREVTPLLLGGDDARDVMNGSLPGGLTGTLARHSPELAGMRRGEFTVVVTAVPESAGLVRAFSCRSRAVEVVPAYKELEQLGGWRRLSVESVEFNRAYVLEVMEAQRDAWVLQLFSPAFIAWLTSSAPDGLCFEVNEGHLCVAVPRALEEPGELEEFCAAAAHVATRLREESLEEEESEAYQGDRELERKLREQASKVSWSTPPESVQQAISAYAVRMQWRPRVLLKSLAWALPVGAVAAAIALVLPLDIVSKGIGIAVAGALALGTFVVVRTVLGHRAATRVGLEAFVAEYARAHGLELEDRRRFHVRNADIALPGVAQHAMSGPVGPDGLEATLAFCADDAHMFSRGQGIAYTLEDGRPLASDVLVFVLPGAGELPPGTVEKAVAGHDELEGSQAGRKVAIWRPFPGALLRTRVGVDQFLAEAAQVAASTSAAARSPD